MVLASQVTRGPASSGLEVRYWRSALPEERKTQVVQFGVFEVNVLARELRKHGTRVRLRGQPFCILSMLLERPGETITRDEMRQRLWPADTFVDFDHSLNTAIKKLRAALGDSPEKSRYIETIPRVGYRFIAPVLFVALAGSSAAETVPARVEPQVVAVSRVPDRAWLRPVAGGLVLLAMLTAVTLAWWRVRARHEVNSGTLTMAVLPFANLTGDPSQEYFSDGLTEEMISQLGQISPEKLRVIARTSVMRYKNTRASLAQIGAELGVQYVLEGSVRRNSGRVLVTAQLVRVAEQTPVWSREYDRQLSDLLNLQYEVAQEIADEMQVSLGGGDPRAAAAAGKSPASPNSYEAYDLYLQGLYFWNKRTKPGFERAADFFQQAIARDPNYARAYAGLADTYGLMSTWSMGPQGELMPKARAAALRALELDGALAEAHASLALVAENYDYDWRTAEKEMVRAIQLDPGYATAHQWYAECLSLQGRFDEALAESERARQLDPLSVIIAADYGAILYFSRQYDRAIEQFRTVQTMEPDFGRAHMISYAYVEKGMFREALTEAQEWRHSDGTPAWEIQAFIYGRAGERQKAQSMLEKWEQWHEARHTPVTAVVPVAYVAMGRKDDAIALLEKAYAEHSNALIEIGVGPAFDPLRDDVRFQDLLRRIGFTDTHATRRTSGPS